MNIDGSRMIKSVPFIRLSRVLIDCIQSVSGLRVNITFNVFKQELQFKVRSYRCVSLILLSQSPGCQCLTKMLNQDCYGSLLSYVFQSTVDLSVFVP